MKRPLILLALLALLTSGMRALPQQPDTTPPDQPVRLVFIHHSTGGNWLADPAENPLGGDLGRALMDNNYYVSATNYGWGPDSIGDATDIPNWLDWFRGERSSVYLEALYNEDGQNFGDFGVWPRLKDDPGGENRIIVFKSCFPNSELEGRPNDPPAPEGWLTVSNAKYVYNEILKYFGTRPDKLFMVVTAPPLSSSRNAANARAFNDWLVNDWLKENDYALNNVAVFDFYNVLTGADHHHRVVNGQIEHTYVGGQNLLHYPSGDDHPSKAGNSKATAEFVPMLNVFYNRWIATAPDQPPADQPAEPPAAETEQHAEPEQDAVPLTAPVGGVFNEDFESGAEGWEAFHDEGGATMLTCAPTSERASEGMHSLQLAFDVAQDGWATCARMFDSPQDWSVSQGLSFALQASAPGAAVHVDIYSGTGDQRESYYYALEAPADADEWSTVVIPWSSFQRVDWEENAGAAFAKPGQVSGIAFGFPSQGSGTLWVDDLKLLGGAPDAEAEMPLMPGEAVELGEAQAEEGEEAVEGEVSSENRGTNPVCRGPFALPLGLAAWGLWMKKRSREE
jgi:hypothetical protein